MAIAWSEDFATGDARIDDHHRQIFRFANRLEAIVDLQELESLLAGLEAYIANHFRYEEACMLRRGCPAAKRNSAEHIVCKGLLGRSIANYRRDGYRKEWGEDLYRQLEAWLSQHICEVDRELRNYPEKPDDKRP